MIEWDVPFTLSTPQGGLDFNQATTSPYSSDSGFLFLLDESGCSATPGPLRVAVDPVPQADGSIIHPSFKNGYEVKLSIQFWVDGGDTSAHRPACDCDRRVMWDTLVLHCESLLNPDPITLGSCRLVYTPSCAWGNRMVNKVRVVQWPTVTFQQGIAVASLTLQSDLPYEMDESEQAPFISTLPGFIVTNYGNTESFPVFKVNAVGGTMTEFAIFNTTTGQAISYNSALPGASTVTAGNYIEIDTFRNTAYLNGSGANRKAGINVAASDFWALQPGDNELQFAGLGGSPTCQMLWNNAWAN